MVSPSVFRKSRQLLKEKHEKSIADNQVCQVDISNNLSINTAQLPTKQYLTVEEKANVNHQLNAQQNGNHSSLLLQNCPKLMTMSSSSITSTNNHLASSDIQLICYKASTPRSSSSTMLDDSEQQQQCAINNNNNHGDDVSLPNRLMVTSDDCKQQQLESEASSSIAAVAINTTTASSSSVITHQSLSSSSLIDSQKKMIISAKDHDGRNKQQVPSSSDRVSTTIGDVRSSSSLRAAMPVSSVIASSGIDTKKKKINEDDECAFIPSNTTVGNDSEMRLRMANAAAAIYQQSMNHHYAPNIYNQSFSNPQWRYPFYSPSSLMNRPSSSAATFSIASQPVVAHTDSTNESASILALRQQLNNEYALSDQLTSAYQRGIRSDLLMSAQNCTLSQNYNRKHANSIKAINNSSSISPKSSSSSSSVESPKSVASSSSPFGGHIIASRLCATPAALYNDTTMKSDEQRFAEFLMQVRLLESNMQLASSAAINDNQQQFYHHSSSSDKVEKTGSMNAAAMLPIMPESNNRIHIGVKRSYAAQHNNNSASKQRRKGDQNNNAAHSSAIAASTNSMYRHHSALYRPQMMPATPNNHQYLYSSQQQQQQQQQFNNIYPPNAPLSSPSKPRLPIDIAHQQYIIQQHQRQHGNNQSHPTISSAIEQQSHRYVQHHQLPVHRLSDDQQSILFAQQQQQQHKQMLMQHQSNKMLPTSSSTTYFINPFINE